MARRFRPVWSPSAASKGRGCILVGGRVPGRSQHDLSWLVSPWPRAWRPPWRRHQRRRRPTSVGEAGEGLRVQPGACAHRLVAVVGPAVPGGPLASCAGGSRQAARRRRPLAARREGPGRPCRQPELAQAAAMSRQHTEDERIDDTPHEPAGIEEELTALHRSWPKSKKMVASMEFSPSAGDAAHDSGGGEVPGRR